MRSGAWGPVAEISGIECVGIVRADPDGRFTPGQKVTALMGGMGRTLNGSYAEVTSLVGHWLSGNASADTHQRAKYICVTSVHGIVTARHDPEFRRALNARW